MIKSGLITDFYELTMMQGYYLQNHNPRVVFDMFYRTNPFHGGYTIFTGLEELIDKLESLSFSEILECSMINSLPISQTIALKETSMHSRKALQPSLENH